MENKQRMANDKAEETIQKGGNCHRTQETFRTWRHHRCQKVEDRCRNEHMGELYESMFMAGLDARVPFSAITQVNDLPAVDQRHFLGEKSFDTRVAPESGKESRD